MKVWFLTLILSTSALANDEKVIYKKCTQLSKGMSSLEEDKMGPRFITRNLKFIKGDNCIGPLLEAYQFSGPYYISGNDYVMTIEFLFIALVDDGWIKMRNKENFCGFNDWKKFKSKSFDRAECFHDAYVGKEIRVRFK